MAQINLERFLDTLQKSANIGKTANGGLNRLALTATDKEMRDLFVSWLKAENLAVRIDDFGNIYGRREGKADLPPIVMGSHLDTQPKGGRFDGILGVLSGLEVIRTLNEHNIETMRPIEIINFTNEEGARFEPPLLGSGGMTEIFDKTYVYEREDKNGITFGDALTTIGYCGEKSQRLQEAAAYVELHIEQGPVLEVEELQIGAVEGILGMSWFEITISGKGGHAGPTPMHLRADALLATTEIIQKLYKTSQADSDLLFTCGRMSLTPNIVNCIPDEVVFTIDVRHKNDQNRSNFIKEMRKIMEHVSKTHQVHAEISLLWEENTTNFDKEIVDIIASKADEANYTHKKLYSGAGHDAMYMNRICPTAMIFIPSIGGISHVEHELSLDEDMEKGIHILMQTTLELANKS